MNSLMFCYLAFPFRNAANWRQHFSMAKHKISPQTNIRLVAREGKQRKSLITVGNSLLRSRIDFRLGKFMLCEHSHPFSVELMILIFHIWKWMTETGTPPDQKYILKFVTAVNVFWKYGSTFVSISLWVKMLSKFFS